MAYTTSQLTTFFTNANAGTAPSAAQVLTLTALSNQNSAGTLTDAQALAQTIDLASDTTTAVAVETYQFFTGTAPSQDGIKFINAAFVGTGAQAGLNGENRFIAQSVALALQNSTAKTAFNTAYGALSVADATKAAYNIIIGNAAATAAGINVDNAVSFLTSTASVTYYTNFVKANVPGLTAAADIDLAVKAAIVGEIMYLATTYNNGAGVGSYATATTNLIKDLSDDGLLTANNVNGINLFTNYGTPATSTPGTTSALTTNVDALVGTANDDTFVGTLGTGATLNAGDTLDGGAGADTLTIFNATAAGVALPALNIKNVETISVNNTSTGTANVVSIDANNATGVTAFVSGGQGDLKVTNIGTSASVGIRDVAYTASAAATITADGARKVDLSGVTIATGGTATITVAGTAATVGSSLSVVNSGKAATITELKFGASDAITTKTLSFNLAAATTIGTLTQGTIGNELTTLNVSGNGALTITNAFSSTALATVDASANAGGLSLSLGSVAGLTSLKGSAAADTITLTGALGATAVVDLGAGNDTLTVGTAPTAGATISGGDGTDTLVLTAGTVYTASTKGQFTNFETATLSGATFSDATLFSGFGQVNLAGTVTVQNVNANPTYTLQSGTVAATVTLANSSGTADVVNLNLGVAGKSVTNVASTIAIAGVETLNINSINGTTSSATSQATNGLAVGSNAALSKIVVTGSGQLNLDVTGLGKALNIDASAATAGLTVSGTSPAQVLNIIGTAVNDTLIAGSVGGQINAGKGGDSITLGAGADIVILKGGDSALDLTTGNAAGVGGKGAMDLISAFAIGTDKLDLTQIAGFGTTGQGVATATVSASDDAGLNTLLATANVFKDGGGLQRGVLDITGYAANTHFIVVDVNHDGSYTAGTDLVVKLVATGAGNLTAVDFNFGS